MRVLFADDDGGVRALVAHVLSEAGHEAVTVGDGAEALVEYGRKRPDVVILDVVMPGMDGYEVCRHLRNADPDLPIIILTAKGDIGDKSIGFKSGADDYLVKPFMPEELLLRMDALMRRSQGGAAREQAPGRISIDGLEVDAMKRTVAVRGKTIPLTSKELQLLSLLAGNPGRVFTHGQLVEEIWGPEYEGEIAGLKVLAHRLRRKIEDDPANPRFIQTVWHVGYRFGGA